MLFMYRIHIIVSIRQWTSTNSKNTEKKNPFFFRRDFIEYQDVMRCFYFKECYIEGELDFIFGDEQSLK